MPYLHIYWPVVIPGAIKSPSVTFVGPYDSSRAFKQTRPRSQSVTIIYRWPVARRGGLDAAELTTVVQPLVNLLPSWRRLL